MLGTSSRIATILHIDSEYALLRLRAMLAPEIELRRMLSETFEISRVAGRQVERTGKRPAAAHRTVLDMNCWFPGPRSCAAFAMSNIRPSVLSTVQPLGDPLLRQFLIFHAAFKTDIFVVWPVRSKFILLSAQLAFAKQVRDVTAVHDSCFATAFEQLWLTTFSDHLIPRCCVGFAARMARRGLERFKDDISYHTWLVPRTNRRGQDKSREVRPVGRLGNVSNLNHAPNIAKDRYNSPSLVGRCSSSVFDTLRCAR
jgi:hypothetical protein